MAMVILRIVLFLLPFVLFYLWMRYLRQVKKGEIEPNPELVNNLKYISLGIGVFILLGGVYLVMNSDTYENRKYIPPKTVDGKIQPGHFEDEDGPKKEDVPENENDPKG